MSKNLYSNVLFPFQREAVQFICENRRCLLALDTGLGKTLIALTAAEELGVEWAMVICPAFLKDVWRKEIEKWGISIPIRIYSYTWFSRNYKKPKDSIPLLICDESHYVKNWKANRTNNIIQNISTKAERVVFMTATPIVRSAEDLHPMLSSIQPGEWGNRKDYCEKFCRKVPDLFNREGWRYSGVRRDTAEELRERTAKVMLRKSKDDVGLELPERIISTVPITIDRTENSFDREAIIDAVRSGRVSESLATERREIGEAKVKYIAEWVNEVLGDEQYVIFCWHRSVVNRLMEAVSPVGNNIECIHGDVPMAMRNMLVEDFQKGEIEKLVCTIGAAGHGLTLTAARYVIFAELPWTYMELKQSADRVYRIGQDCTVFDYRFIASGTIDEVVLRALESKVDTADRTVGHIV